VPRRRQAARAEGKPRLVARCAQYFQGAGRIIDQVYQPRLTDGIVRCYQVRDRLAGFGEQLINALYPAALGAAPADAPQPGPRLYYPPTRPDFQKLKNRLERPDGTPYRSSARVLRTERMRWRRLCDPEPRQATRASNRHSRATEC